MAKKIFYSLFIVAVIVAVVLGIKYKKPKVTNPPQNQNQNQTTKDQYLGKTEKVDQTKLPPKFPADFPLEKNAEITNNSVYKPNDAASSSQSTREFLSEKTIQQNFGIYQTYLKNNNWKITGMLDQKEAKALSAEKDVFKISITITTDSVSKKTLVSVFLVYK